MGRGGGGGNRGSCCDNDRANGSFGDCDFAEDPYPQGPAFDAIINFIKSDDLWILRYIEAWNHATENGYSELGKIGTGTGQDEFKEENKESLMQNLSCQKTARSCFFAEFGDIFNCFWQAYADILYCAFTSDEEIEKTI